MSDRKCERCSTPLQGRQQKYCSRYCKRHMTVVCPGCQQPHDRSVANATDFCRSCVQTGERNNQWRGGHRYWQEGKLGRDKDGLSWKIQRQLAWDRDNYTCQDCGKTREQMGCKPHVDHVIPYRISRSHALDNLLCRCPSCHKKAEAKRTELWDGRSFGGGVGRTPAQACKECGSKKRKLNEEGRCHPCLRGIILIPEARRLREAGESYQAIADRFDVTPAAVWYWLNDPGKDNVDGKAEKDPTGSADPGRGQGPDEAVRHGQNPGGVHQLP